VQGGSYAGLWELREAANDSKSQAVAAVISDLSICASGCAAAGASVPKDGTSGAAAQGATAREQLVSGTQPQGVPNSTIFTPSAELRGWTWHLVKGAVATPGPACAMGLAGDGSGLLISCSDKAVYEYALPTLVQRNKYRTGHSFAPLGVTYVEGSELFLTGSPDHSIALFKRSAGMNVCAAAVLLLVFGFFTVLLLVFVVIFVSASLNAGDGSFGQPLPEHFALAADSLKRIVRQLMN